MGRYVQSIKATLLSQNESSRKGTGNPRPHCSKTEKGFWKGTENPDLFAAFGMLTPSQSREYAPIISPEKES